MLVVVPVGIPDFAVAFGWMSVSPSVGRLRRRGAGHDLRRLPPGLPPGGRQPAQRRPRPRRGGPQPRRRSAPDLLASDARPGPPGHLGRFGPGGPGGPGRVRGLRDPRVPDVHHRDLQRVPHRLQHPGGLRPLPGAGAARRRGAGRRGRAARPGPGDAERAAGRTPRPSPPPGPGPGAGGGRLRGPGGPRPRGPAGGDRLLALRVGGLHPPVGVARFRRLAHRPLQRLGGPCGHGGRPAGGAAVGPLARPEHHGRRAQHVPGAGHAGSGDRPRPHLLLGERSHRVPLPEPVRC